jgi:hypothetical protein
MTGFMIAAAFATACLVSPVEDPVPGIIGKITGQAPAWLIDGSSGHWESPEARIKTLWVLSKKAGGTLHIEGRRLNGEGIARFQDGGVEGTPANALDIDKPWNRAWPSNATPEVRRDYAFVPNYVLYPSRGCWQFTVRLGENETRITIEIR